MFGSCSREPELTQALRAGHWPEGCLPELRAHVQDCTACSELALLTQTFQKARAESEPASCSAAPGVLWWRAQLRMRVAANARVNKPISIAETFAFLVAGFTALIFAASQYRYILRWFSWWGGVEPSRFFHSLAGSGPLTWNLAILLPSFLALIALGGALAYLVWNES